MSKAKRGKSGSSAEVGNWESELSQAVITENEWKPLVVFLGPDKYADTEIVNLLCDTIKSGLRKLFSVISYEKLLMEVKEIVGQKGNKGKGVTTGAKPQYSEICDQVKVFLDQGEAIPIPILAKLVKFKLLMIKTKDIERRELEKKLAANGSKTKVDGANSKTGSPTRARSQSPGKGGKKGGKKDAERPPSPKNDTKLKKRGEENNVIETIDDEPDEPTDPQHYIIMTGFTDATLFNSLIEINVTVNAMVNVKTDYHKLLEASRLKSIENGQEEEPSNVDFDENTVKLEEEIKRMWEDTNLLVKHAPIGHLLRNMAKFDILVQDDCFPEQLSDVMDSKGEFAVWLFGKVADVCYDMLDYMRHYERYLDQLKIINVSPHIEKDYIDKKMSSLSDGTVDCMTGDISMIPSEESTKSPPCDLRYYDKLMSSVPLESETVPIILDCLLEQVVAVTDGPNPMDQELPPRPDGLTHLIGDFWDRKLAVYGGKDNQKLWKVDKKNKFIPDIVYSGDEKRAKSLNITSKNKDFNADDIEKRMRNFHPYANFIKYLQPSEGEWMENCIRRKQLYNFCRKNNEISEEKFERAMRQYIFESLPLEISLEVQQVEAVDEQLDRIVSRWDYPYYDVQQAFSDSHVEKESSCESTSETFCLRKLDSYNWLERFEPAVLHQVLDKGSDMRPYLDTYYNRGNNTLLVVLHNPCNENLENSFQWDSWLHSDVGFRNFLEHVAFEIQEWTEEQDQLDEEKKAAEKPKQVESKSPPPPAIKERSRCGLKTRTEINAEKEVKDDKGGRKKSAKSRSRSVSPKKNEPKTPDKKKSENKARKPSAKRSNRAGTATKRPGSNRSKVSFSEETQSEPEKVTKKDYTFVGYNLGDSLFHLGIDQSYLFPRNGALIKVEKLNYIQQNTTVQITIMYKGDTFSVNFANPIKDKEAERDKEEKSLPTIQTTEYENENTNNAVDPERSNMENDETKKLPPLPEEPPYTCAYSNITGTLSDGVLFSFSAVNQREESEESQKVSRILFKISKELSEVLPPPPATAPPKSPKGKKGKRDEDQKQQEELEKKEAEEAKKFLDRKNQIAKILTQRETMKNLYLTTPNGIHMSFKHGLIVNDVEQYEHNEPTFLLKLEHLKNERDDITLDNCNDVKEIYRCITSDGLVLKYNSNETVEILSPFGDVYQSTPYPKRDSSQSTTLMSFTEQKVAVEPAAPQTEPRQQVGSPTRSKKGNSAQHKPSNPPPESVNPLENVALQEDEKKMVLPVSWGVIGSNGERWRIDRMKEEERFEDLMIADATCFETKQVLQTREDGVVTVHKSDGTRIVEYLDSTRITTTTMILNEHVVNQETGESSNEEIECEIVIIEHDIYPTTIVDLSRSSIQVTCSNGRDVKAFKNGGYLISKQDIKDMAISSTGEVSLYPSHFIDCKQNEINFPGSFGKNSCILKQTITDSVCLVDCHGNKFKIDGDGEYSVDKSENYPEENAQEILPRYFVVHADGSGEELLRYEDVYEYLKEADHNSNAALLHGSLESDEEATTVTIIKPHQDQPSQIWKPKKIDKNIVPVSLRERDFKTLPQSDKSIASFAKVPKFGSSIHKADLSSLTQTGPVICPNTLEIRHLVNYKELTSDVRNEITNGINKYGEYVAKQQEEQENMKNVDERNEEEKEIAQRIKEKYYKKHGIIKENPSGKDAGKVIADQYVDAITPPKPPSPRRPHPERPAEEWENDKKELEQCEYEKYIIRTKNFPPYFQTEQGQQFLRENPDMDALSKNLARSAKQPMNESNSMCSTPSEQSSINPQEKLPVLSSTPSYMPGMSSSLSMNYDVSANSLSPFSSGLEASSNLNSSDRPLNPTPQKAGNMVNLTRGVGVQLADSQLEPIDEGRSTCVKEDNEEENYEDEIGKETLTRSLLYDVSGSPRKEKVKTPSSILGSRPNAIPNEKFSEIEDPVRRQTKTASVHGAVDPELTSKLRGFVLLPDLLDFGLLTEGYTYTYPVKLKNVGVDLCRYKIKQPPPSTGLKIVYKPGPVAAGMEVTFDVEIFAVAVGVEGNCGVGKISHHVEIITETDILYLPVIATVVTQQESENPSEITPRGGPSKGTLVLDKRPSSRETIRPRKE